MDNIKLEFSEEALDFIVDQAVSFKLGARGLRSICESIMLEAMFDMPSKSNNDDFIIDKEYAEKHFDKNNRVKFGN